MFLLCPTSAIVVDTGLYLALHGLSDFGNVVDTGLKQELHGFYFIFWVFYAAFCLLAYLCGFTSRLN